ncbi:hypothetical protein IP78_11205 [Brevundimonas sp. AAP58]|uniref:hypothetical protein n=1 Tax=Brevundimonas sp. AAP58 TaxID=1523422 RepID=UPI0006B9B526|nr:hypothetical protein [Brevundimonas sp. AAP58]KPF78413.1 hypothetical protein IP78_11205 [Brevundimonas sp. AAP58]
MRLTPLILALAIAAPAAAQDVEKFNLYCQEVEDDGRLSTVLDHHFSLDLETMTVCREGHSRCWEVVRQGRFLELSYAFNDGRDDWQMFRLYDPASRWLVQNIRKVGEPGMDYGSAQCEVRPFRSLAPDTGD